MRARFAIRRISILLSSVCAVFCVTAFANSYCYGDDNAAQAEPQTGVAQGVLTGKGEAWIAVRADGEKESTKLVPRWIGGLPQNGGGLDKQVLAKIREIAVGSRVKVAWLRDEHLRVVDIEVLAQSGQDGEEGAGTADGSTQQEPSAEPTQKSGNFAGVVVSKGENWIAIRPDGERESQKFYPRWIGGSPQQGGGLDKEALQAIKETAVGAHVQVGWVWNERYRLTALQIIPKE